MHTANNPYSHKWWSLLGLSLLSFTAFLDYTIVATALPFIQKELHASVLQLQWVMSIFTMVLCMFMIISGKAGDLFGQTKVFYIGFILFGIAAFGAGYATDIQWLIFFRAIQGFAAAIIFTIGVALLPQAFPKNEQTRAIGIFSAFNGAGLASGPFLGGLLISLFGWRWVFWINIPIIIVGILLCAFSLKPSTIQNNKVKIDFLGLILLITGLGCLVYGIIYGEQNGWTIPSTIALLIIGSGALVALFFVEQRVTDPLLDMAIFKDKRALLAIYICVIAGLITSVFLFFDPLYLELMRQQSALIVGVTLLSVPLIQVIISLCLEFLVTKFGIFNLLILGLITAVLSALCHVFFTPTISIVFVLIALMLMGYTWGIANAGTITAIHDAVPAEKLGSSIGTIFTFWNISGSVFLALASVIFHWGETINFNSQLKAANIIVTPELQKDTSLLITNPDQAQSILQHLNTHSTYDFSNLFIDSFMFAFHWVAISSCIVMVLFLIAGFFARRNA